MNLDAIALCVACYGSGKATNGAPCHPCQGRGRNAKALDVNLAPYSAAFADRDQRLNSALETVALLEKLTISNDAECQQVGAWLRQCKTRIDELETQRKTITGPLNDAKRAVDALFKPVVSAWEKAELCLKSKLIRFQAQQQQERAAIAQAMAQQHAQQNIPAVMALAAQAQTTIAQPIEGVQFRKVKRWRVVDPAAIPLAYLQPNETAIAAAMRDGVQVPGIQYYEDDQIAAKKG